MTENHAGRRTDGWGDKGRDTNISVVVKRSAKVGVFMSDGGQGMSIHMSNRDAIIFAQAIMAAATGVNCYEDAYEFEATTQRRAFERAQSEDDECTCDC